MKEEVHINIGDWVEELLREEVDLTAPEAIENLVAKGYSAGQIARMAVSARLNGLAPEDILKPDKLLYYAGARRDVAEHVEHLKCNKVRKYIGRQIASGVDEEPEVSAEEPEEGYAPAFSSEGLELAKVYLLSRVPAHVLNHLRIVAANGGEVREVAEALCERIMELVEVVEAEMAEVAEA